MLEVWPVYTDKSVLGDNATGWFDSGINDWLVKMRSLIYQTRFEFIDVSYFVAVNFLPQNTPNAALC